MIVAGLPQMLDNFGNFASWTEWSLAFNLFSEPMADPANPSNKIQVRSLPATLRQTFSGITCWSLRGVVCARLSAPR